MSPLERHGRYERTAPGGAESVFGTPWRPPDGLTRTLAAQLPAALLVRGSFVEAGNEYAGRFEIAGGNIELEEVAFTPEFRRSRVSVWTNRAFCPGAHKVGTAKSIMSRLAALL